MPHIITPDPTEPEKTVTVENLEDVISHLSPQFGPEGYATRRSVDAQEVCEAFNAIEYRNPKRRVRVYSAAGFVPNSYRYDCKIQFVEAERTEAGDWAWHLSWGNAQRANARATRQVVR
jgi:hypothetical protein